ncbi:MAG: hypothetical protein KGZ30_02255 [Anaplasmataceae bacterium]|nr:hypothetical protein [Anaplasmataceae bacterium]
MKKLIAAGLMLSLFSVGVANAATDYYLKIDGVDGESKATASATTNVKVQSTGKTAPDRATGNTSADGSVEVVVDASVGGTTQAGESTGSSTSSSKSKGNVEYNWKVEEGEKMEGVEPDEIDYDGEAQPLTPDFSILLGGGSGDDGEAEKETTNLGEEVRTAVAAILLDGVKEKGMPMESISFNFEKIQARVAQPVKLFGFIPMTVNADVEIDAESQVKVQFPWWSFLATGKDGDNLGQRVSGAIADVLKTKHDTVKNAIQNIR